VAGSDRSGEGARWQVFISHTSELRAFPAAGKSYVDEVERAVSAARHVIVDMADFAAKDQPPARVCAERVRGCDVYVGVLGTRYGSPVRDKPEVSYTELEFDTATAARLPRLVFVLDTAAADVGIPLDQLIDDTFGARQKAFRRRVQNSGLTTQSFRSPAELGRLVERSLRELAEARRGSGPLPPGSVLRVWNIPARNPGFTGRDGLLEAVRERLLAGDTAAVQALQGMGGVGKTQLAAEYAHQFADSYDLAWWVNSDQPGLIGDQFATLGAALGCVLPEAGTEAVRTAVLAELRGRGRWLLVFDNAENPADVRPWLPGGSGHVLITSRERRWTEIAAPVEVKVLARSESVAILQGRVGGLGAADAARLADQLGDLPLAVAQAAGFMAETGMPAGQYLELLWTQAGKLLAEGAPESYPRSLAAATQLIADRLDGEDPAASQLASVCAFLATEPIPEDLFTSAPGELPGQLAARVADPLAWRQTLAHLTRQSLARVDHRGLQMHRLTQAILRDRLTAEQAAVTRACTEAILATNDPADPENPDAWPRWAQLMPHLLAADLATTENSGLRWMASNGCRYLLARGDTHTAHNLADHLRQQWRARLGADDQDTLAVTHYLGWALREMGRYAEARDLHQDTLERRRRVLGEDHPDTLTSANNLANDLYRLGEVQAARDLYQDTLERRRRVLGEDHPDTLTSASNLANDLYQMGEVQAARDLDQDTLERRRRVLGEDHPDTLTSASNLADDLRLLGESDDDS
jgi:tetratricopeptide (TPR) repeat protein